MSARLTTDQINNSFSRTEVARFVDEPPTTYRAYVNERDLTLTTWMGDVLGQIQLGHSYNVPTRGYFPSTRQSIRVKAINGRWYTGTYYCSSGTYAHIMLTARKGW